MDNKTLALLLAFFRIGGLDFASMGAGLTGGIEGWTRARELPNANFNVPGAGIKADAALQGAMWALAESAKRNAGLVDPVLQQAFQQMLGIDLSPLISAGQQAGGQYGDLAQMSQMYSGMLGDQAQSQFGAGADLYNLGRDPNNELHNFMKQQTIDDSRAASSARGIGMGANAAGLETDANRRFEMDWQNQLLGRAATGLQGMNQANYLGGMGLSNSMAMGAMAPEFTMQSAQAPINAQQTAAGLPMDWANAFTQAQGQSVLGPQAGVMSSIYPYLGMAQQGQQAQFNATVGKDKLANDMTQQSMYGIWGGGQSGTNTMQGNQSGAGNPMNWIGMAGGMGGM